ncbi:Transcriptional regulator [Pseudomonas savastanoi]|nr:Transcriptional regulator [Pseudomonas savastanoi pv. fraxini]RMS78573.1 Transcriptional regulator [Pseudomonas savastanoi]
MLHIAPLIPAFRKLYPHINIKVLGENRYFDIIDSEVDLAIRTKEYEPDSNITIRRLAETRRVLAASPGYLKRKGIPRTVADLAEHDLLIYSHANKPRVMRFTQGENEVAYKVEPILETNDGQIVRAAALAGGGILVQPKYIINADLVAGRLIPVIDDWDLPRLTINMAFQSRRYMPTKLRVFIDFLLADFNEHQYEDHWTR